MSSAILSVTVYARCRPTDQQAASAFKYVTVKCPPFTSWGWGGVHLHHQGLDKIDWEHGAHAMTAVGTVSCRSVLRVSARNTVIRGA